MPLIAFASLYYLLPFSVRLDQEDEDEDEDEEEEKAPAHCCCWHRCC